MGADNNDIERSLLQKAIRRGNEELVVKVLEYLIRVGDLSWLRKRLFVIAYEECWTLAHEITTDQIIEQYKKITRSVKNKNVAGLAALVSDYRKGNYGVLDGLVDDEIENIKSISNAIDTPKQFWTFIRNLPGYQGNYNRIESAVKATAKATFEHDKLLMFAASCLTAENQIPDTLFTQPNNDSNFPYWIAFDKHTTRGKEILIEASNKINLDSRFGMKLAFYFEGSICNQIVDSPYWTCLVNWEMRRMGFSIPKASQIWEELKQIVVDLTSPKIKLLITNLNTISRSDDDQQISLF